MDCLLGSLKPTGPTMVSLKPIGLLMGPLNSMGPEVIVPSAPSLGGPVCIYCNARLITNDRKRANYAPSNPLLLLKSPPCLVPNNHFFFLSFYRGWRRHVTYKLHPYRTSTLQRKRPSFLTLFVVYSPSLLKWTQAVTSSFLKIIDRVPSPFCSACAHLTHDVHHLNFDLPLKLRCTPPLFATSMPLNRLYEELSLAIHLLLSICCGLSISNEELGIAAFVKSAMFCPPSLEKRIG